MTTAATTRLCTSSLRCSQLLLWLWLWPQHLPVSSSTGLTSRGSSKMGMKRQRHNDVIQRTPACTWMLCKTRESPPPTCMLLLGIGIGQRKRYIQERHVRIIKIAAGYFLFDSVYMKVCAGYVTIRCTENTKILSICIKAV